MKWVGWIAPLEPKHEVEKFLKEMGIELGLWIDGAWAGCTVPDEVMSDLDKFWGKCFWGLEKREG